MQISSNGGLYYGQLGLQRSQQSLDQASAKVAEAQTVLQMVPEIVFKVV